MASAAFDTSRCHVFSAYDKDKYKARKVALANKRRETVTPIRVSPSNVPEKTLRAHHSNRLGALLEDMLGAGCGGRILCAWNIPSNTHELLAGMC